MKIFLLVMMMTISLISCSQQKITSETQSEKSDVSKKESKLEQFTSKSGQIVRYVDYKLSSPKLRYRSANAMVRVVNVGTDIAYFLVIESEEEYRSSRAAIAHEDLLEIIKALTIISDQAPKDIELMPDYLENRFVSDDGFIVGYFVSKSELSWFMSLERFGSGGTIFPRNEMEINNLFHQANEKINELKAMNAN